MQPEPGREIGIRWQTLSFWGPDLELAGLVSLVGGKKS